jgi:hypothetical protein
MSDARWLITRTVACPCCRADATLSYALSNRPADRGHAESFVYLCPSLCRLPHGEIAALLHAAS